MREPWRWHPNRHLRGRPPTLVVVAAPVHKDCPGCGAPYGCPASGPCPQHAAVDEPLLWEGDDG